MELTPERGQGGPLRLIAFRACPACAVWFIHYRRSSRINSREMGCSLHVIRGGQAVRREANLRRITFTAGLSANARARWKLATFDRRRDGLRGAARAKNQHKQAEQAGRERDESQQMVQSRQRVSHLRHHVRGFMSRMGRKRLRGQEQRDTEAEFPKNFRHARKARHGA